MDLSRICTTWNPCSICRKHPKFDPRLIRPGFYHPLIAEVKEDSSAVTSREGKFLAHLCNADAYLGDKMGYQSCCPYSQCVDCQISLSSLCNCGNKRGIELNMCHWPFFLPDRTANDSEEYTDLINIHHPRDLIYKVTVKEIKDIVAKHKVTIHSDTIDYSSLNLQWVIVNDGYYSFNLVMPNSIVLEFQEEVILRGRCLSCRFERLNSIVSYLRSSMILTLFMNFLR
jgi:hypothetical protein